MYKMVLYYVIECPSTPDTAKERHMTAPVYSETSQTPNALGLLHVSEYYNRTS